MSQPAERFVPKVHPATRAVEPEDPMTLHAVMLTGDPEVMLECLVQEYAWMGWGTEQILSLFRDPFYPALNELQRHCGEAAIRDRVTSLVRQMGVIRCQVVEREETEQAEPGPELIELGIRHRQEPAQEALGAGEDDHAQRV
jgi:hypothetical protein